MLNFLNLICIYIYILLMYMCFFSHSVSIYSCIHPSNPPSASFPLFLTMHHASQWPTVAHKRYLQVRFTHPHFLCLASLYDGKAQNISSFCSGLRHSPGPYATYSTDVAITGIRVFTACWATAAVWTRAHEESFRMNGFPSQRPLILN